MLTPVSLSCNCSPLSPNTCPICHTFAGTAQTPAVCTLKSVEDKQPMQDRSARISCVWNEANAVRVQLGLPLKDLHISLGSKGTDLGSHSLTHLLSASPFELDERKLIQVSRSALDITSHLDSHMAAFSASAAHQPPHPPPTLQLMQSDAWL